MAQLVDDVVLDASAGVHRPRNLDWKRAAALLYGDWGTSKAYVIGLAFLAAGFSSLPIILAVCAVTALVGINYIVICRHFPDGGGVYSSARSQGRLLAVVGALLLVLAESHARGSKLAIPYRSYGALLFGGTLVPMSYPQFHDNRWANQSPPLAVIGMSVAIMMLAVVIF